MRALLLDANNFESYIEEKSTRPATIVHDSEDGEAKMKNGLVAFFTIEKDDTENTIQMLFDEIMTTTHDFDVNNVMIAPFVHLSKNIAEPKIAQKLYAQLIKKMDNTDMHVFTSHFGYHKKLLLDIKGHPGSFRYREF